MSDELEWVSDAKGFGVEKPIDDYYHGKCGNPGASLTETWYWGFQDPKTRLHAFIYIYMHPNVGSVTGGVWVKRGDKSHAMASELFDIHSNMSDDIFDNDRNIKLANGFQVKFIDPMKKQGLSYRNDARDFSLDVEATAVTPAFMRSNNKHFEQVMRMRGTCKLEGKTHDIDCLTIRDRSWGELRSEAMLNVPPYTWINAIFSADFLIQCGGHDDPAKKPDWAGAFPSVTTANAFKDGYVYRNGKTTRFAKVSMITTRDPSTLRPLKVEIEATDLDGQNYQVVGKNMASAPWNPWHNCHCHIGFAEWTCNLVDTKGYGEIQEVQWNPYVSRFMKQG